MNYYINRYSFCDNVMPGKKVGGGGKWGCSESIDGMNVTFGVTIQSQQSITCISHYLRVLAALFIVSVRV